MRTTGSCRDVGALNDSTLPQVAFPYLVEGTRPIFSWLSHPACPDFVSAQHPLAFILKNILEDTGHPLRSALLLPHPR